MTRNDAIRAKLLTFAADAEHRFEQAMIAAVAAGEVDLDQAAEAIADAHDLNLAAVADVEAQIASLRKRILLDDAT